MVTRRFRLVVVQQARARPGGRRDMRRPPVGRYDTIKEFNVDLKADCDQLNLAHETKTNNRQRPLSSVQVKDPRRMFGTKQIRLWRKGFVKVR